MIAIRLVGPLEMIAADGRPVALPTRKAEALVARLSLRPGKSVSRAELAGLLWPDRPDEQGRQSVRQALAAVRRAFAEAGGAAAGPSAGGDAVALDPAGVEVDSAVLERELRAAAPAALLRALERWRGPLLAGFPPVEQPFDDWLASERTALARRALDAVARALAANPDDDRALSLADAGLAIDAAFEEGYRTRMAILARRGDRAGALREHARCREALLREVGVEPSAATEALRREIATQPGQAPPPDPRRAPTLAVRPFEILSPDASHELFARGLEEDVLAALSRFRHLHVVGPAADRRASDGERGPGADYLLLGSIRASAGRLRVNARLVDGRSGAEIWGERTEADLADVFSVQDRIARAVVATLAARIDEAELAQALRQPGAPADAYGCWLRGMRSMRVGTREADLEARRHFERALSIDPTYARAYSGLSLSHFNDWSCAAWERWDENERLAFEYATQGMRLDDRDHVTHCILGRILLYRREFSRAAEHFSRALALNQNDPDVLANLALGHAYLGEPERGLELGLAARRLNPIHADWYFPCIAANHFVARRPREGLELVERAPDGHVDTRAFMAAACAHLGERGRAREHAARFLERFRAAIVPDGTAADAVSWMLRVNPFRREEDRAYLLDGLARAGIPGAG